MTNIDIIKELYRAFSTKDYKAFLATCDPDLEWIQNEGFPRGARHIGAQAVVDNVFKAFDNQWERWTFQIEEYLDAGQQVVVTGWYAGHHQQTRRQFRAAAAHLYDLRDGKVVRFRQFADTKPIWDAMPQRDEIEKA